MIKISDSIYSVGALNPNLRVFDIVMRTEFGTSYNSYLVRGEKTALIETCHDTFFGVFLENIQAVCDPSEVDYIILNHTEPDHSGALARLLPLMPKATIVCSQAASIYLKNITNCTDLPLQIVKDGEKLSLGDRELQFINAPFLHWPDSMFTYYPTESTLFSCDFFGAHYCEPRMLDIHVTYQQKYDVALKGYFDAIFGPFLPYVQKGLEKIKGLKIDYCCTSHGPILTSGGLFPEVMEKYHTWSLPKPNESMLIPIFYCSAYGNTANIAKALYKGVSEVLPHADVRLVDLVEGDIAAAAALVNKANAVLCGSPTINRDAVPPIWQLLSHVDAINSQKKPASAFGSYGWSGEAVPSILTRLAQLKFATFEEGLKVNFVPSQADIQNAIEFGRRFAGTL